VVFGRQICHTKCFRIFTFLYLIFDLEKGVFMTIIHIRIPNWLDRFFTFPLLVFRLLRYGYTFRRIYLSEDAWTILDWQDYYRFGRFKWEITGNDNKFYAVRSVRVGSSRTTTVRLHRLIMNAPQNLVVDHINGDSLDNRRANLRLATQTQNLYNRKKKENTSSQFIGSFFNKSHRYWCSQIKVNGKSIWLGSFDSEIAAARAYDKAALEYHKEFARLNFPEAATPS